MGSETSPRTYRRASYAPGSWSRASGDVRVPDGVRDVRTVDLDVLLNHLKEQRRGALADRSFAVNRIGEFYGRECSERTHWIGQAEKHLVRAQAIDDLIGWVQSL